MCYCFIACRLCTFHQTLVKWHLGLFDDWDAFIALFFFHLSVLFTQKSTFNLVSISLNQPPPRRSMLLKTNRFCNVPFVFVNADSKLFTQSACNADKKFSNILCCCCCFFLLLLLMKKNGVEKQNTSQN